MIVDMHCHPFFEDPTRNEAMAGSVTAMVINLAARMGKKLDIEEVARRFGAIKYDRTGDSMIESMDEAGIDVAVLLIIEGLALGAEENQTAGQIAKKCPDKIVAFAGIDPRNPDGPDRLKKCFEEYGCRGLKYHPGLGFDPSGPESYELLKIVADNKGILLSHTGPLGGMARSSTADVSRLADLIVDFPEIPVVAAHMGLYNWRPWASLAAFHENLYGDLAMWDLPAFGNYPFFCRELRDLIDCAGIEKIAFGTDDPNLKIIRSTKDWVELIKNLPKDAPEGITFTEEEVASMLGGNAARILRLAE